MAILVDEDRLHRLLDVFSDDAYDVCERHVHWKDRDGPHRRVHRGVQEVMICPHCGADLDGGSIWQTGYELAKEGRHYVQNGIPASDDEAKRLADEYAASYGATRDKGRWGRQIRVYSMERDRTTHYICPDCEERL